MSETPTPETDAMEVHKDDAVWRSVVPSKFARRLERERDAARIELSRVRKELVSANRGAETNAKVNQGLCTRLAEAERERDEASREWDDTLKEWALAREGWSKALEEMDEARRELDLVSDKLCKSESAYLKNEEIIDGLKNEIEHTETFFREKLSRAADDVNEAKRERDEARRERDEARRERDEAMDALKWIAGRYCHEKTTFQLAQLAYEMSSKARWTLNEIEQKDEA